jgi:hypothetical protein
VKEDLIHEDHVKLMTSLSTTKHSHQAHVRFLSSETSGDLIPTMAVLPALIAVPSIKLGYMG